MSGQGSESNEAKDARAERLAARLRDNLRRRKAQARARAAAAEAEADGSEPGRPGDAGRD